MVVVVATAGTRGESVSDVVPLDVVAVATALPPVAAAWASSSSEDRMVTVSGKSHTISILLVYYVCPFEF